MIGENESTNSQMKERKIKMAIVHLTKENFEKEVMEANVPVLIDFWATWCGPCQMVAPVLEEIANEHSDVKICKVNVDEEPELTKKHFVMSIPMFFAYKDGNVVKRDVGAKTKEELLAMIDAAR